MSLRSIARAFAATVHAMSRVVAIVSIAGMFFVMMAVVYNVFLREVDQPPLRGIVEYVELGMVVTAFFAIGDTERRRQHVSVDEILERMSGRVYTVLRLGGGLAAAFIAILLAFTAWEVLSDSIARGEYKVGLIKLPMWPARLAVFVGFLVLALEQVITAVEDVVAHARGQVERDPLAGHAL